MPKRFLTPQEKKALSYENDRRNCYGESPHGARKIIPRRKAAQRRGYRHAVKAALREAPRNPEEAAEAAIATPRGRLKRFYFTPLKVHVAHVLERRRQDASPPGTRSAKRAKNAAEAAEDREAMLRQEAFYAPLREEHAEFIAWLDSAAAKFQRRIRAERAAFEDRLSKTDAPDARRLRRERFDSDKARYEAFARELTERVKAFEASRAARIARFHAAEEARRLTGQK